MNIDEVLGGKKFFEDVINEVLDGGSAIQMMTEQEFDYEFAGDPSDGSASDSDIFALEADEPVEADEPDIFTHESDEDDLFSEGGDDQTIGAVSQMIDDLLKNYQLHLA